jgi:hypothetical protein
VTRTSRACLSWSCRPFEAICADKATAIWFTAGPPDGLFPCLSGDWLVDRPQLEIRSGSVFHRANSPSEFLLPGHRAHAFAWRTTCLGLRPPPDFTSSRPFAQLPQLGWRRPRRSQPLDDFRNEACELVSSRSQVQDCSLVQGFIHSVQPSAFIRLVPPLPFSFVRSPMQAQAATYATSTPTFSSTHSRCPRIRSLNLLRGRAPLRVRLLLQVTQTPATTAYPSPITHAVTLSPPARPRRDACSTRALDFSALPTPGSSSCLQDLGPARAFRTFQPAFQRACPGVCFEPSTILPPARGPSSPGERIHRWDTRVGCVRRAASG